MPFTATTYGSPSVRTYPPPPPLAYALPKVNTIFFPDQDETKTPMQAPVWPFEAPDDQGLPTVVGSEKASSAFG